MQSLQPNVAQTAIERKGAILFSQKGNWVLHNFMLTLGYLVYFSIQSDIGFGKLETYVKLGKLGEVSVCRYGHALSAAVQGTHSADVIGARYKE